MRLSALIILIALSSCGKDSDMVVISEQLICNRFGYGYGEEVKCNSKHFSCVTTIRNNETRCTFSADRNEVE